MVQDVLIIQISNQYNFDIEYLDKIAVTIIFRVSRNSIMKKILLKLFALVIKLYMIVIY